MNKRRRINNLVHEVLLIKMNLDHVDEITGGYEVGGLVLIYSKKKNKKKKDSYRTSKFSPPSSSPIKSNLFSADQRNSSRTWTQNYI